MILAEGKSTREVYLSHHCRCRRYHHHYYDATVIIGSTWCFLACFLHLDFTHFVGGTKCYMLRSLCFVPTLMPCHISSRKRDSEGIAIRISASGWQRTKEMVQKCFAKADFRRTETMKPGAATYIEGYSKEINEARWQLGENYVVARDCSVDEFVTGNMELVRVWVMTGP